MGAQDVGAFVVDGGAIRIWASELMVAVSVKMRSRTSRREGFPFITVLELIGGDFCVFILWRVISLQERLAQPKSGVEPVQSAFSHA